MKPGSIYGLNIENFLGLQKLKEDSSFLQFEKLSRRQTRYGSVFFLGSNKINSAIRSMLTPL
jgi:hypothetical protein